MINLLPSLARKTRVCKEDHAFCCRYGIGSDHRSQLLIIVIASVCHTERKKAKREGSKASITKLADFAKDFIV
jgi:hypothetical protein